METLSSSEMSVITAMVLYTMNVTCAQIMKQIPQEIIKRLNNNGNIPVKSGTLAICHFIPNQNFNKANNNTNNNNNVNDNTSFGL